MPYVPTWRRPQVVSFGGTGMPPGITTSPLIWNGLVDQNGSVVGGSNGVIVRASLLINDGVQKRCEAVKPGPAWQVLHAPAPVNSAAPRVTAAASRPRRACGGRMVLANASILSQSCVQTPGTVSCTSFTGKPRPSGGNGTCCSKVVLPHWLVSDVVMAPRPPDT